MSGVSRSAPTPATGDIANTARSAGSVFSLARSTPVDGLPIRHCVPRPAPWYCRWFGGTEHRSRYQIAFEFLPCVPSSRTTTTYMYILHLPQQLRDSDQTPSGPLAGRRLSLHLGTRTSCPGHTTADHPNHRLLQQQGQYVTPTEGLMTDPKWKAPGQMNVRRHT